MTETTNDRCVIVGASHAGAQTAMRLRRCGWTGEILLVGEERHLPYHRPPLSKDYLKGEKTLDRIALNSEAAYAKANVTLRLGCRVTGIDRAARRVETDDGGVVQYDKLVLALGSRARPLPVPGADGAIGEGVYYLRTAADVDKIRSKVQPGARAVVIGGGYIGLEAAASLRSLGLKVTVLEAMDRVLHRVTCATMSAFYARLHREEGVDIRLDTQVVALTGENTVRGVELAGGETIKADLMLIGIGILPNTELAASAGLATDNGIVVDGCMRTADPNVYAVGDCASVTHARYGEHVRLESVQNANDQAMTAARALCGTPEPYAALPWFWSDQYGVKLQIAGLADGHDEIVTRGDPTVGRCFSLCYLRDGRLLAVDAVNSPRDFLGGKKLILADASMDREKLADPGVLMADAVVGAT